MIDIRSHLLGWTGSGSPMFAESLEMYRAAACSGVRKIVATSLWGAGRREPPPFNEMDARASSLAEAAGGAVSVSAGFVLEFSPRLPELSDLYGRKIALGGGRHLLVSLPKTSMPVGVEKVWDALSQRGFSVVLASPECSPVLRRNWAALEAWSFFGVKFQVDAASVTGAYGRGVQKFALDCLRRYEGSAVVASNACSANSPTLSQACDELTTRMGLRRAQLFVSGTPSAILGEDNQPVRRRPWGRTLTDFVRSLHPVRAILN